MEEADRLGRVVAARAKTYEGVRTCATTDCCQLPFADLDRGEHRA